MASGDGIDSETPAINAVRRQELDHRQHTAAALVAVLNQSSRILANLLKRKQQLTKHIKDEN